MYVLSGVILFPLDVVCIVPLHFEIAVLLLLAPEFIDTCVEQILAWEFDLAVSFDQKIDNNTDLNSKDIVRRA